MPRVSMQIERHTHWEKLSFFLPNLFFFASLLIIVKKWYSFAFGFQILKFTEVEKLKMPKGLYFTLLN